MDSVIEWKNRIWTTSVQSTQIISMRSRDYNKNAQPWSRRSCQLCFGCTDRCMIRRHLINFLVHLHIQSRTTLRPQFTAFHLSLINKTYSQCIIIYQEWIHLNRNKSGLRVFFRNLNEIFSVCFIFPHFVMTHIYLILMLPYVAS